VLLSFSMLGKTFRHHPADGALIEAASRESFGGDFEELVTEFARTFYLRGLKEARKDLFVDKTPRNYQCLDLVNKQLKGFQPIVLLRDPIDIAESYLRTWNINIATLIRAHTESEAAYDFILGSRWLSNYVISKPVILIRYADAIFNIEDTLRSISLNWGLGDADFSKLPSETIDALYAKSKFGEKIRQDLGSYPKRETTLFQEEDKLLLLSAICPSYLALAVPEPRVDATTLQSYREYFNSTHLEFYKWSYSRRLRQNL
jgi:hypothetical protein